jgi:hypothetical protein
MELRKAKFGSRFCFCDRVLCMCSTSVYGSSLLVGGYLDKSRSMP